MASDQPSRLPRRFVVTLTPEEALVHDTVIECARRLVVQSGYCTVAQSGDLAGTGNHLRDALDALYALEAINRGR